MRIGGRQPAGVTIATSARCNTMTNTNTNTPKAQPLTNTKANRIFGKTFLFLNAHVQIGPPRGSADGLCQPTGPTINSGR